MIRTPRELFESLQKLADELGGPGLYKLVSEIGWENVQVFDFGDVSDIRMGNGPSIDLWEAGILNLPFRRVIYRFKYRNLHVYVYAGQEGREIGMYQWRDDDGHLYLDLAQSFELSKENICVTVNYNHRNMDPQGNPISQEMLNQYVSFFATTVIHLSMMLCTKNIGKRHEPAPAKLNKKRARSGKPPLPAVTYIDVSPYRERDGSPHPGAGAGVGKAPHLRRGHIRHFDDGSITWVRDCVVNIENGPAVGRDHYVAKERKHAHSDETTS